jgi:hypothetical protein
MKRLSRPDSPGHSNQTRQQQQIDSYDFSQTYSCLQYVKKQTKQIAENRKINKIELLKYKVKTKNSNSIVSIDFFLQIIYTHKQAVT